MPLSRLEMQDAAEEAERETESCPASPLSHPPPKPKQPPKPIAPFKLEELPADLLLLVLNHISIQGLARLALCSGTCGRSVARCISLPVAWQPQTDLLTELAVRRIAAANQVPPIDAINDTTPVLRAFSACKSSPVIDQLRKYTNQAHLEYALLRAQPYDLSEIDLLISYRTELQHVLTAVSIHLEPAQLLGVLVSIAPLMAPLYSYPRTAYERSFQDGQHHLHGAFKVGEWNHRNMRLMSTTLERITHEAVLSGMKWHPELQWDPLLVLQVWRTIQQIPERKLAPRVWTASINLRKPEQILRCGKILSLSRFLNTFIVRGDGLDDGEVGTFDSATTMCALRQVHADTVSIVGFAIHFRDVALRSEGYDGDMFADPDDDGRGLEQYFALCGRLMGAFAAQHDFYSHEIVAILEVLFDHQQRLSSTEIWYGGDESPTYDSRTPSYNGVRTFLADWSSAVEFPLAFDDDARTYILVRGILAGGNWHRIVMPVIVGWIKALTFSTAERDTLYLRELCDALTPQPP